MRLVTLCSDTGDRLAVATSRGFTPVEAMNERFSTSWPTDMFEAIKTGQIEHMKTWYQDGGRTMLEEAADLVVPASKAAFAPPYRHPSKIWGIGLNYADHAGDLASTGTMPDTIPGSFMKADTTIIGPGDAVRIPRLSQRTTGEAELGIIIGKRCKDVDADRWRDVVAGFTTIIDMTAEDILKQNTRYLTVCKNFDTFFSFGPEIVTPDEIEDVMALEVATIINGQVHASNVISNMRFPPGFLVSFHSKVMTLLPGDIISSGTPRAVPIKDGDVIECMITGFPPLRNPVIDVKTRG